MYILIAVALAMSLFITAAPAQKVSANTNNDVTSEWDKVSTPSLTGWVLAPQSKIMDYAVSGDGDTAYSILYQTYTACNTTAMAENPGPWYLLKSTNGAATWSDITKGVKKEIDKKHLGSLDQLVAVACDPEVPDFLAVALSNSTATFVFVSDDGGTTFKSAGKVNIDPGDIYVFAVSTAVGGDRDIAIGGTDGTKALLFRATVTGTTAAWEDATADDGWNDEGQPSAFSSNATVAIQFSPNWKTDHVILALTVDDDWDDVYLQSGVWGETPAWNKKSSMAINAIPVITGVSIAHFGRFTAGIALPQDYYQDKKAANRYAWVWVNYYDGSTPVGKIFLVKATSSVPSVSVVKTQIEDAKYFLSDVSYWGTIAEGKAIAGILGNGFDEWADCCVGVQVYRNDGIHNMDICCVDWEPACKPPTGRGVMDAFYVNADRAYAVALFGYYDYDEAAWSVSFDDPDYGVGYVWNQLSLIDTNIDYLSDVAVSPDCNKMMLVSVNLDSGCGACDSVWLKAKILPDNEVGQYSDLYSGHWFRTWCGNLTGDNSGADGTLPHSFAGRGLLRLPPASVEKTGDTVYLVDRMTDTIYLNDMETFGCWTTVAAPTVDNIVDLAVSGNETLYALDHNGDVALYDDEGWHDSVDSKVDSGWTIAVHSSSNNVTATDVLVGGYDGQVSYSSDSGDTFALLEETPTIDGQVTVAFDSYFDTNNVIYAATARAGDKNGIYRWVIDTSDEWKNLGAEPFDYTGLVLGFQGGNPFSEAANGADGGVLYASYIGMFHYDPLLDPFNCFTSGEEWMTGVARCLTPAADISCEKCVEWDYLTVGLPHEGSDEAFFRMVPDALKACGCTEFDTNTELFAIGKVDTGYDMCKAEDFTVWTFEDCFAKQAPTLVAPSENVTVQADCWCSNLPFSLKWTGVCDACVYDVQIALNPDFTDTIYLGEAAPYYEEGGKDYTYAAKGLSFIVQDYLTCQVTYYWRVRAHQADTCQVIHSWWSDTGAITVAPSTDQGTITLIAPLNGANDVAIKNVGFSWTLQATATKYDWKLSTSADLSSAVTGGSQTGLTHSAYTYTGTLSYDTTYYWQVIAWNGNTKVSTSAVGTFRTMVQPTTPTTTTRPTPPWVWVVIAIGAVLVIVVIVLIFRTRRV
jgi:hypothetical protein